MPLKNEAKEQPLQEKIGIRVGFFAALIIFSSLMYFAASKFRLIPQDILYFTAISAVVAVHLTYSILKEAIRK